MLAAGSGLRLGGGENKVFASIGGKPMLAWSLQLFESIAEVRETVLVAAVDDLDRCQSMIAGPPGFPKVQTVVPGGPTRHDSEYQGVRAVAERIEADAIDLLLVHDAARPFATAGLAREVLARARRSGAAVPAVQAPPQIVVAGLDRVVSGQLADLRAVQTPQGFKARLLLDAHRRAAEEGFKGTDTASVVEWRGQRVDAVLGQYDNIKITTPMDLIRAEQIARHRADHADGEPLLNRATTTA